MTKTRIRSGRAFTYLDCMGRFGLGGPGFLFPVAVARNQGDTIYVASYSDEFNGGVRITKCTLGHEWITDIGLEGDGQFLWPGGIALDRDEDVYVTDQAVHKVVTFKSDGTFLGRWGTQGSGPGEFNSPSGLSFDKEDNLYVVDSRNHRLQKYTGDGDFLSQWGVAGAGAGQFNLPWGISLDTEGGVYVADWGNNRVQKLSPSGEYLASFGGPGTGKGELNHPSDVAIDKDGDVYVCDWGNNRVNVYSPDGDFLVDFTGDATELSPWAKMFVEANPDYLKARERADLEPEWRLRRPVSVDVGDDYRIVIAEAQHNRLQVYLKDVNYMEAQDNL